MLLREILETKGKHVYSISPEETLQDVVTKLVRWNCGSLMVVHEQRPTEIVGIITERDILRACAAGKMPLGNHRVSEAMTAKPLTASPYQSVEDAMGLMTTRRIRHLPLVEDSKLVGIVSIGDVVKAQHDALTMENHYLKTYIQS
ncbi:MAG: CBS domain-containing protein [Pirellulales bacterium]